MASHPDKLQAGNERIGRVPAGIEASPPILAMFERFGPSYVWFAVITSLLASFAALLTTTIINVAIPEIMGAFGVGQNEAQWLSTGFLAAGTVTMLLTSWCIDAVGVKLTFVIAMLVFLAGSILGGLAPSHEVLVFSRIITGAAAGIISPIAMVINFQIFPVHKRGFAMGLYGIGVVLAPALGPAMGGFLIDFLNWRYVFFVAIPFSMVSIPLALIFMPDRDKNKSPPPFDTVGFILAAIFLATMLTALSNGHREGWGSSYIVSLAVVALMSFTTFISYELQCRHPLLELRIFANKRFLAASFVTLVVGMGLYGSTYLLPIFLQGLQGISPTTSGLLMVPAGLAMAVFFPIAGALSDRIQPRFVVIAGLLLFALSNWLMRHLDVSTPYAMILIWAIIGRVGLALIFPSLNVASLSCLPLNQLSQGSGAINFIRQLGGALGVNLLSIFLLQRNIEHSQYFTETQTSTPTTLEMLTRIQDTFFGTHFGFVMEFPPSLAHLSNVIYSQAMTISFREGFLIIALLFLIATIPTWLMKPAHKEA